VYELQANNQIKRVDILPVFEGLAVYQLDKRRNTPFISLEEYL
jgi:hypothetical protein